MIHFDGSSYEGEFSDGKQHGKGILYYKNGKYEKGDQYYGIFVKDTK